MKNLVLGVTTVTLCMAVQAKYILVEYNQPDQQNLPGSTQEISANSHQQQILDNQFTRPCPDKTQVNSANNSCVVD